MNFRAIIWSNHLWFIHRHFLTVSLPDCWGVSLEQRHWYAPGSGDKLLCLLMRFQIRFTSPIPHFLLSTMDNL